MQYILDIRKQEFHQRKEFEMKRITTISLILSGMVFAGFQKMEKNVKISEEYISVTSGMDSEIIFSEGI